ncbi:MAG: AraC family transcriptional regulator [Spirochaetales bacterium]|nr:AraC family transcriptional regulator [Spirochaetales bacterium]
MIQPEQIAVVNQAINHVHERLSTPLTAEALAHHCRYSRHHFNRLFTAVTGESVYGFIKRQKLETGACLLMKYPQLSITDIASFLNYSSSNFSDAFFKQFGLRPNLVRKGQFSTPAKKTGHQILSQIINHNYGAKKIQHKGQRLRGTISIHDFPERILEYTRVIGPYCQLQSLWKQYISQHIPCDVSQPMPRFFGIAYNDPLVTQPEQLIYDLCTEVKTPKSLQWHRIPSGRYACYHFEGPFSELFEAYNEFMAFWLPTNITPYWGKACLESYAPCPTPGHVSLEICVPFERP